MADPRTALPPGFEVDPVQSLPPGFALDPVQELPEGFEVDAPGQDAAAAVSALPAGFEPDDVSWYEVGKKVIENAPAMMKMGIAGQAQSVAERPMSAAMPIMGTVAPNPFDALVRFGQTYLREKMGLPEDKSAQYAADLYGGAVQDMEENAPNVDPNSLKGFAYDAAQSTIQMIPGIAATFATKKPIVGATIMGGQVAGQKYAQSRAEGRTPEQASMDAKVYGLAEGIPEMVPLGVLMKPGGRFLARTLKTAGAEGLGEMMTQIVQDGYDAGVINEDMTWSQAMSNMTRAGLLGSVVGGAVAVGTAPFARGEAATEQERGTTGTQPGAAAPATAGGAEPSAPAVATNLPEVNARVGLRREGGAPEPVVVEAIQDGYVFYRDPDGNQDAATVADFQRDMTEAPPPARPVDATTVPPPLEAGAPPPPEIGDINDFDPFAPVPEPEPESAKQPTPQAALALPDTARIDALKKQARLWEIAASEAEERAARGEPGSRTPEEIAFMRQSAQQAATEAAELSRTAVPPRMSDDATAATPEQMAARGMGALSAAAPATSEATTGPREFEVVPPKAPPAAAQATLEPVARSEAEVPQPIAERPAEATIPWEQRLRRRIAARSAPLNNQELLAKQLGVTPQDVAKELTGIAASKNAPIQIMQGRVKIDPKTKMPVQSKFAGKFRYTPRPTGKVSESLSDLVYSMGGIRPPTGSQAFAGELEARDLQRVRKPFKGSIVNPNARMNIEQMAEHAFELGWRDLQSDSDPDHADVNKFLDMLEQDAHGRRKFYALGEEPIVEPEGPERPATRQERKAQAIARLKELGFEPRGTTVEELESDLDYYENIIGDMPRVDAPELHLGAENEAVDRMSPEAQDALKQEAANDFPHEYDEEWLRQELAEGDNAAQPAAPAGIPPRGEQAGAEPAGEEGIAGRDAGAAASPRDAGPTSVLARLIKDESGAVPLPEWKQVKAFFEKYKGKKTAKQVAADGNRINLGQPDTLRRMATVGPYVYNGAWLASQDRPSAVYFNAMLNQQNTRSKLETQAFEKAAPYFRLSKEEMRTVDAMLEYYRLYGITPRRTGRNLVVKIPDRKPPFGEAMPSLSKPGQILAADAKMTDAVLKLTEMFGDTWRNMHEAIARERGYTGEFTEKSIQRAIDGANDRHAKRAAEAAMEVFRNMEESARTGYTVPLQRYGDTYISVTPKAPEDAVSINSPVHVEFVDTKSFFRNPFKSVRGGGNEPTVDERMADLRKKFPPSKFNIKVGQVTPNEVATLDIPALERALMAMNVATEHQHEAVIDDLLHQVHQKRLAGFRQQARNVAGYSTDFERAIADYIRQTSSTIARLSHRDDVQSAYDATQHHADPAIRKYWENYKHYLEKEGGDFNTLRKVGFFMMMWGSPSSAMLDLTQTPLITQFQLASWAGIRAPKLAHQAMLEAMGALQVAERHGLRVDLSKVGKTDAEKAMLKRMAAEGRLGPQISREFQGSELSSRARNARPHLKKMGVLWEYGASMKNAAEEVNRVAAALAAFRAAQNPQLLEKAAKVYADDQLFREQVGLKPTPEALANFFVDDTQFIAGKINRAPSMRGIGSLVFQFKNYPLNYVRLMHKNFTRMGKEGKIVGSMMLIALLMASGILGAPFAEDALKVSEGIYKGVTGIDPMLEYRFRKMFGDEGWQQYAAELITRGAGRNLFGADFGQRIGMGELFPSDSITDTMPIASAIVTRGQEMMERGSRGQPVGAAAAAANFLFGKGGYDIARAVAQSQEGVKTKYGSTIQSAQDTTLGDIALRALGIQPTKLTRKTEKTYAASRIADATKDAKNRLTTELATLVVDAEYARREGDKEKAAEIMRQFSERMAEVASDFAEPGTPAWQKLSPSGRTALRRRIISILLPEIARLRATPRAARAEVMSIPYPE